MKIFIFSIIFTTFLFLPTSVLAEENNQNHFTLIINQVRGTSCCDKGSLEHFNNQAKKLKELSLNGNFSLRYDALKDQKFIETANKYPEHEIGGLLEIIPSLASDAGVEYLGSETKWHEANHVFLIGYTQEQRKKLIDTYMSQFKQKFNRYPTFTNAWMIDAWSLKYLKSEYGVLAHEITREQYGTDSYTLYGGPVHYPYWPSVSWALMPDNTTKDIMPLILRQTITDPVFIYGDNSDSYTSQPNDYFIRADTTDYFKHLFQQAHLQPNNSYTFALIGLENSMPENVQTEYMKQLEFLAQWQNSMNQVLTVTDFQSRYRSVYENTQIYEGVAQKDTTEKAWWINTPSYRARIRLSNNTLFISDLRIFDPSIKDPYYDRKSTSFGWWITPFVLDGSRFFYEDTQNLNTLIRNDYLKERKAQYLSPTRIELPTDQNVQVKALDNGISFLNGDNTIASFNENNFYIDPSSKLKLDSEITKNIFNSLQWKENDQDDSWGFNQKNNIYTPFININSINSQREKHPQLLFPELKNSSIDSTKTSLLVNNAYAIASRNPVRLILFPVDDKNNPVVLFDQPSVQTEKNVDKVSLYHPHGSNGMIFIDVENSGPDSNTVTIKLKDFQSSTNIYFAPNCKKEILYCITHPKQTWWFLRSLIEDRLRSQKEKESKEEKFVDG